MRSLFIITPLFLSACAPFHWGNMRETSPQSADQSTGQSADTAPDKNTDPSGHNMADYDLDSSHEADDLDFSDYETDSESDRVGREVMHSASPKFSSRPYLSWPLPRRFSMGDGFNGTRNRGHRKHLGIDFPAPKQTPIFAAHDGWVTYTGSKFRGYGRMVIVDNGHGWQTLYAHMSKIHTRLRLHVQQGDVIGEVGASGHAHGAHLHFELMQASIPINPTPYMNRLGAGTVVNARRLANRHASNLRYR